MPPIATLPRPMVDPYGMANAQAMGNLLQSIVGIKQRRRQEQVGTDILNIIGAGGGQLEIAGYLGGQPISVGGGSWQLSQPQAGQGWLQRIIESVNPMTAARTGRTSLEDAIMGRITEGALDPMAGLEKQYLTERIKATQALARQRGREPAGKQRLLNVWDPKGRKRPRLVPESEFENITASLAEKGFTFEEPKDSMELDEFLEKMQATDAGKGTVKFKKAKKQALMRRYGHILPQIKGMGVDEVMTTYGPLLEVAAPEIKTTTSMAYDPNSIYQPISLPAKEPERSEKVREMTELGWRWKEEAKPTKDQVQYWIDKGYSPEEAEKNARLTTEISAGLEPRASSRKHYDTMTDVEKMKYLQTLLRAAQGPYFGTAEYKKPLNPAVAEWAQKELDKLPMFQERGTEESPQGVTATNPQTGEKIISYDGGKTWQPLQ